MRIRTVPLLIAFLLVAAVPREASADRLGFFRWWDSLSGPGPFKGFDYSVVLRTRAVDLDVDLESSENKGKSWWELGRWYTDITELNTNRQVPYIDLGAEIATLWTDESDLDYAAGVVPPTVHALPILGTVDIGWRGLDGGVGIGLLRLSSSGVGNWHSIVEPRVSFKPFVFFTTVPKDRRAWHEAFRARLYWTRVGGSLDPADYGALGPEEDGGEWVPGFSFSMNVLALFGR